MIRINFLPEQKMAAPVARHSPALFAVGAVVLLGVGSAGFIAYEFAELASTAAQLDQSQHQLTQTQALLKQAQDLHKQEDGLTTKLSSYQALKGRVWSSVLLGFADRTPEGLSWNAVEADDEKVHLTGHMRSLSDAAQFMTGLTDGPQVGSSFLSSAVEGNGRYSFDLTVKLAPHASQPGGGKADGHQ